MVIKWERCNLEEGNKARYEAKATRGSQIRTEILGVLFKYIYKQKLFIYIYISIPFLHDKNYIWKT